jgi:hypothetical protein
MKPTIGRIVHYTLSEHDAAAINKRRDDFTTHARSGEPYNKPTGYVAHIGNRASAGDTCAATIVRTWGDREDSAVNLKVHLDGNDDYWATSATQGDGHGHWRWPERA